THLGPDNLVLGFGTITATLSSGPDFSHLEKPTVTNWKVQPMELGLKSELH
ncbi:hypothetical protein FRX31_012180, partial [Thalictrum thalictroides]